MSDDLSPTLGDGSDRGLAPAMGGDARVDKRAWWRSLKGPIAVLLADLEADNPLVRRRAVEALARLGDRRAVPALARQLRDRDWKVRLACVQALGRLRGDGVISPLARATRDGHPRVRLGAAEILAVQGDPRGIAALDALLAYLDACGQSAEHAKVKALLGHPPGST
jgi:HEAT repeat protein